MPWWQVNYGIESATVFNPAIMDNSFSMGRYCSKFEQEMQEYLSCDAVAGVTSGSDAILISLMALKLRPGETVMVQDRSWIAAANAAGILGLNIIAVDVDEEFLTISLDDLSRKYQKSVKALVVVHMNGRHHRFKDILRFAQERNIPVIEDAAQALGSKLDGRALGTFGDLGAFSLSNSKIIGSGQGGFVAINKKDLIVTIRELRIQGTKDVTLATWESLGFNFRLTDLHALIASNQLKLVDERIIRLKEIFELYTQLLIGVAAGRLVDINFSAGEVGPYIEFILSEDIDREKVLEHFANFGIELRPFYPSITTAPYLSVEGECKIAKKLSNRGLYLPSGPAVKDREIREVCEVLQDLSTSR